jgi:hypothetical protein
LRRERGGGRKEASEEGRRGFGIKRNKNQRKEERIKIKD